MRRRSRAGGKPVKARRRKAATPKRASPAKAVPGRRSETTGEKTETARLIHEREEALQQLAATEEILRLISNSPTDTQPVFDTIVQSGLKLFPDAAILIALPDGNKLRAAAFAETDLAQAKALLNRWPISLTRQYLHVVAILDRKVIDIPDARKPTSEFAAGAKYFLTTGYRAITIMPMLSGNDAIGALSVVRSAPGPLSERQIAALRTFAAQAVIAIENTRLLNELRESLQQQTAIADVLKTISRSTFDLQAVLETLTESAARLCDAKMATIARQDGDAYYYATTHGFPKEVNEFLKSVPYAPGRGNAIGRCLLEGQTVHIPDVLADPEYVMREIQEKTDFRTALAVPLLREGRPIGVIGLLRSEVRPFSDREIELVMTFADQAVIAIQNVRLFEAEQQRTRELSESLEQQTATSEVLSVISRSPGELEPVFQAMLANATRLCEASYGGMWLCEGDAFRAATHHGGLPAEFVDRWRSGTLFQPSPNLPMARAIKTRRPIHIVDLRETEAYREGYPMAVAGVNVAGIRSMVAVPMFKENEPIGVLSIYRKEVRPFTERQIELVQNFAAQAVIAIENTRLLNELRESLQQQNATADVLKVISRSTFDLPKVLGTLVESATKLCNADKAYIYQQHDGAYQFAASYGFSAELLDYARQNPITPGRGTITGRVVLGGKTVHVEDVLTDPEFTGHGYQSRGDFRTTLGVPLTRNGTTIGVFFLARSLVRPFTNKEINLVTTFADQAVIAIENARLLNELRELLEQQTATSQVLSVISSSPGELETVFQTMLENAVRICDAKFGFMNRYDGNTWKIAAVHGAALAYTEYLQQRGCQRPGPETVVARVASTNQIVHIADLAASLGYAERDPVVVAAVELGGVRTLFGVPMLKEDELIGAILLYRQEVRPFTDKQIELVQNFAAQAVIAIENTRLLNELREVCWNSRRRHRRC